MLPPVQLFFPFLHGELSMRPCPCIILGSKAVQQLHHLYRYGHIQAQRVRSQHVISGYDTLVRVIYGMAHRVGDVISGNEDLVVFDRRRITSSHFWKWDTSGCIWMTYHGTRPSHSFQVSVGHVQKGIRLKVLRADCLLLEKSFLILVPFCQFRRP